MPSSIASALALRLAGGPSKVPAFIYGTAWKKDRTEELVVQALRSGFMAVDTAAQPRHYQEHLVGSALRKSLQQSKLSREDIYVQTKYTSINGQDPGTTPYDPNTSIADQVRSSVMSSLKNLGHGGAEGEDENSYIDCLLLHSPLDTVADTLTAWTTLEQYVPEKIRHLGISNINLKYLEIIYQSARIKPTVVQNRFHPRTAFDRDVREFCVRNNIIYQSFWTLTANPRLLKQSVVQELAKVLEISQEAALYCLVLGLDNVVILNGTTNHTRMQADIKAAQKCCGWATAEESRPAWELALNDFKRLIGDASAE